ncbi:hypothetical protein [Alicyclobacillus sendaiensis]|uniref:hypothetical protein n=1 Tax=Alicyclobacillus sendaiensis TaxID=192387 RepID=UPI0026F45F41|nr:hypothetical protein [Alicyclobacillus sendaiensis]
MNEQLTFIATQLKQAGERVYRAKTLWFANRNTKLANQLYERYRAEQAYLAQLLDAIAAPKCGGAGNPPTAC